MMVKDVASPLCQFSATWFEVWLMPPGKLQFLRGQVMMRNTMKEDTHLVVSFNKEVTYSKTLLKLMELLVFN